jgi:hypothetical protein
VLLSRLYVGASSKTTMKPGEVIMETELQWKGPYCFWPTQICKSVFRSEYAKSPGLYLWTVKIGEAFLTNYVGISGKSIRDRLVEHVSKFLGGDYNVYDPSVFSQGKKKSIFLPVSSSKDFPKEYKVDFLERLPDLASKVFDMLESIRLFVGPLRVEKRLLERIESAIIKDIRKAEDKTVAEFIDNKRVSPRRPSEKEIVVLTKSHLPLLGLSDRLVV